MEVNLKSAPIPIQGFIKKLLVTQLLLLFVCAMNCPVTAMAEGKSFSQTQMLSVDGGSMSLKNLFTTIENQSGFLFFYVDADVANVKVNVKTRSSNINEILQEALRGTGLSYTISGKNVSIYKISERQPAQQDSKNKVRGTIKNGNGEPLIGVTVAVEGGAGTITDVDGHYSLSAAKGSTLKISYVGYTTQYIKVGNQQNVDVTLQEDAQALQEVVVVGFGTQKKVNLSGSVSSVNVSDLADSRPVTNMTSALAGTTAGLNVTESNNRPGDDNAELLIRGVGTLNNASPLVIIDGVEGYLSNVNVNDIENISILKDAASSAIYGSRAANGVILVTTKTGKSGKLKVAYNGYVTFQSIRPDLLEPVSNYADFMTYINEGYANSGVAEPYSTNNITAWRNDNGKNPLQYPNENWIDQSFKTGVGSNHTVSMSGGTDKIQFYGSFGYYDNPGVMENSGYQRYHALSNISANLTPWLKMGFNTSGYYGTADPGDPNGAFTWGYATTPAMIFKHNGLYGGMQDTSDDITESVNNIVANLHGGRGDNITRNGKYRVFATITPIKDLSVTGSMIYEYTTNNRKSTPIFHDFYSFATNQIVYSSKGQTSISQSTWREQRNYMDLVAHYDHRFFTNHFGLGVMGGASQEKYTYENESITRMDLVNKDLSVIDGANGAFTGSGNKSVWVMRSYFGRINLDWDNKYLFEFDLRTDGSSRFNSDNRWGWFPSASAAWRIDQEEFMKQFTWLDNLKLRASYGSLGNNSVGNYASVSTYNTANYVVNSTLATGFAIKNIANPNLTWEKTKVADIGLDFGVLNNRLTGTFDWFNKRTTGILIALPAPLVHGTANVATTNAAKVTNKGWELTLSWRDKVGDFKYGIEGNFTHVTNKINKFKGNDYSLSGYYMTKEGLAINSMYMYKVDRIVSTDDDVAYVNKMLANNPDAFKALGSTPKKGDLLFQDLNHDGLIDPTNDRAIVGTPTPKNMFGLTLSAGYKGIDFSIFMQGVTGCKGYINEGYFTTTVLKSHQLSKYVMDRHWTSGSTGAKYPRLTSSTAINTQTNDCWLMKRDYLKIRNIQLGYTFPNCIVDKLSISKLRLYGTLENFFTFTKWKGIDPETSNLTYPTMRQAVIGVNIEF